MLKKYLCGAAIVAALSAPIAAEELFVRNRAFGDAQFIAGTTYVPAASFLRALDVPWSQTGTTVTLGKGDSPEGAFANESVTLNSGDKTLNLSGMVRGGKLYVSAKDLATFTGYTVIHNSDTGIVDVVKVREITAADLKAAEEVKASNQAEKDALKAEREARIAKEKAAADAKAAAEATASGEKADEETAAATDDAEKPAEASAEPAAATTPEAATPETPKEPPKANLVVLSSQADPNLYTGEVVFRAVIQNQGFAPAEGLSAVLSVTGPDGKNWMTKTLYRGPLGIDGRWEIAENYRHNAGGAMPRGTYDVKVTPKYTSGAVAEKN